MAGTRIIVITGAVALAVFLSSGIPASFVPSLLSGTDIQMSSTSGTLWSGRAERVQVRGISLGRVSWRLKPLQLFIGRLALEFDAKSTDGFADGQLAASFTGTVAIRRLRAAYPLSALQGLTGLSGVNGKLTASAELIRVADDWPTDLVGQLRVAELSMFVGSASPQTLGNYSLAFSAHNIGPADSIVGDLLDEGGPLEFSGELEISAPSSYVLSGTVRPRPDTPRSIADSLVLLGSADQDGFREISLEGTL